MERKIKNLTEMEKPEIKKLTLTNDKTVLGLDVADNNNLEVIELSHLPNITYIKIINNKNLKRVIIGEGLENLINIEVYYARVYISKQKFTKLKSLIFYHVKRLYMDMDESYNTVENIYMNKCVFPTRDLITNCNFKNLQYFKIMRCDISNMHISFDVSKIKDFNVKYNYMEELIINGTFKNLINLDLTYNNFTNVDLDIDLSTKSNNENDILSIQVDEKFHFSPKLKNVLESDLVEIFTSGRFIQNKDIKYK